MDVAMLRRQLPAIAVATMLVLAAAGVQAGFGADGHRWSSSLKSGDAVPRGTVWSVTTTPKADEVDFWASGRVIAEDKAAPFETALDLPPGDYKLGFCHRRAKEDWKCETTESGDGTGIVARVTITEAAPPLAPTDTTTTTTTSPTPTTSTTPTTSDSSTSSPTRTDSTASPTPTDSTSAPTRTDSVESRTRTDSAAPKPVRRIEVTSAQASSVSIDWPKSRDNVGVAGYGVYLGGRTAGATDKSWYTLSSLACGTGYTVGVDVFDAAGNRSAPTSTTVSTSACPDLAPPTVPSGIKLAAATETSVVLSWQPSSDNIGVVAYGLYVGGFRVGSASEAAATLTGLSCGKSYEIGIDAVDAAGNRSARASAYFSTASCPRDQQAPSAPGNPLVTNATTTSLTLSWSASTDNTGVVDYGLYRASTRVGSTSATTAGFSGLACGTTYQVGVDAVDAAGNRSSVASVLASTQPCEQPPPPDDSWTSSLKTGDVVSRGTVWKVTTTPEADEVDFWASGRVIAEDKAAPFETALDLPAGDYKLGFCHRQATEDWKCETTESGDGTGIVARVTIVENSTAPSDTTAPSVPGSLRVVSSAATSIDVAWSPSTDDTGVVGYGLYRGATRVGSTSATSASFSGLACGTTYQLGVDAVDAATNRSTVATVPASTQPCSPADDTNAPSTPRSLHVVSAGPTRVDVAWSPSSDNVGVVGYGRYLGSTRIGTTTALAASFSGLACGTAYQIGVDAYDAAGNRSARADMTVTTTACADTQAPTVPANVIAGTRTATSIALSWSPSTDNVGIIGYGLYRGGTRVSTTSSTSGIVSGLTCGTNYTLGVDAYDAAGNRSAQAVVMVATTACADTQAPSTPTGLAVSGVTQTGLMVSWIASTDNIGVVGYRVDRGGTVLVEPTTPSATLSGFTCGTSYTIGVVARDAAGNTSGRATVQGTTAACSTSPAPTGVYLSPSGSDANSCTQASPCRSFQRGYERANPGQTVFLAAGDYGSQDMRRSAAKTSSDDVVIEPAPGATVTVKGLRLGSGTANSGPEHLTIRNIRDSRSPQGEFQFVGVNDITVENLDAANFYTNFSSNLTIRGGDWGPCTVPGPCGNSKLDVETGSNILVENALFHDYRIVPWSGEHFECMIVFGGRNLTIRGNTFRDCEFYDIFLQHPVWAGSRFDGRAPESILIENNSFDVTWDNGSDGRKSAVAFSPRRVPFRDVLVRCNTFLLGAQVIVNDDGDGTVYENFSIVSSC
jgi:chitodextrinase